MTTPNTFRSHKKNDTSAFTLIELLIVIAIIGTLASIVISNVSTARESARRATTVQSIKSLKTTVEMYFSDVGEHPAVDCTEAVPCDATNDPFANALSASGWKGPYMQDWSAASSWGGHIGYKYGGNGGVTDVDSDGIDDHFIILENDRPSTNASDNTAIIPTNVLVKIDTDLDDGNLATGNIRGDGNGWPSQPTEVGELYVKYSNY
jgi:type II secretion system protein G